MPKFKRQSGKIWISALISLIQFSACKVDERTLYPGDVSTSGDLGSSEVAGDSDAAGCGGAFGISDSCNLGGNASDASASGGHNNEVGGKSSTNSASGGEAVSALGGTSSGNKTNTADLQRCVDRNSNAKSDTSETLVLNSAFDTGSELWDPESGVGVVWTPEDACSSSKSGSLRITYTKSGSATSPDTAAALQCLPADANQNYSLSALLFLNNEGSRSGVGISYYPTKSCSGTSLGESNSALQMLTGKWTEASVNAVAPPLTQSMLARVLVGRIDWFSSVPVASVNADSVLLVEVQ